MTSQVNTILVLDDRPEQLSRLFTALKQTNLRLVVQVGVESKSVFTLRCQVRIKLAKPLHNFSLEN